MDRLVVIFDCNVYLDVATLLGGYNKTAFGELATKTAREPLPASIPAIDSLRAVAVAQSGRLTSSTRLEVACSTHIANVARWKMLQPVGDDTMAVEDRGLGFSEEQADEVEDYLIRGLVDRTGGEWVVEQQAHYSPPLDHEDGHVYGTCRYVEGNDPLAEVICVTNDRTFIEHFLQRRLDDRISVLSPASFIARVRRERAYEGVARVGQPRRI